MTIKLDKIYDDYMQKYLKVMEQREEIITAFIAKYGIDPKDIIQIEWNKSPFETVWFIGHKDEITCVKCKCLIGEE